jgi:hypothetical protein
MAISLTTAATVGRSDKAAGTTTCRLDGVTVPGFSTTTLEPAQFQALHTAVTPQRNSERWMEIPWEPDLGKARERAAREGKPLLMWIMDGHPLGCT